MSLAKKKTTILKGENQRRYLLQLISEVELEEPYLVTIEPYKAKGTVKQMRLDGLWRGVVHRETGDDKERIRAFNKWKFGVPILINSSNEFAEMWIERCECLPEQAQIQIVRFMDVTSLFNTSEYTEYLNDLEIFYQEQGIRLPHPDDLYWESMGFMKQ